MSPRLFTGFSNPMPRLHRTTAVMTSNSSTRVRRSAGALGVAALTLALATACGSSGSSAPTSGAKLNKADTVSTKLLSFMPAKLTVKAGTKVTWTDLDGIGHTVTTGTFTLGSEGLRTEENPDGLIDMPLQKGKNVSFTFTKPGKYVYYCSIHKGMNGEIDVTP
jgi:plastocyanin